MIPMGSSGLQLSRGASLSPFVCAPILKTIIPIRQGVLQSPWRPVSDEGPLADALHPEHDSRTRVTPERGAARAAAAAAPEASPHALAGALKWFWFIEQ